MLLLLLLCCYFNPRSYMRSDTLWNLNRLMHARFQSTLLHEERLGISVVMPGIDNFNPRSYMRSDGIQQATMEYRKDFNPRSYMRSDETNNERTNQKYHFNPRSYMRSDDDAGTDHHD